MSIAQKKKKGSAADPIYFDLKKLIVSGEMLGGTPLRQDDIAKQHGVSKIPVREALRRLENEGLVEFRQQRGAIVRKITEQEVMQLFDIRVALECRALELAIPNMIEDDFNQAAQILEDYQKETRSEKWSELNLKFHHCIYEPCGNPVLMNMISELEQRIGSFVRLRVSKASGQERPMHEHHEILNYCKTEDIPNAVKMLRKHIETTQKEIAAYMRRL